MYFSLNFIKSVDETRKRFFWQGGNLKKYYLEMGRPLISGMISGVGLYPSETKFPDSYEISNDQALRWLDENLQTQLRRLIDILFSCDAPDKAKWLWEKSGKFSAKSTVIYAALTIGSHKKMDSES